MTPGDDAILSLQMSSTHAPEVDRLHVHAFAIKSFCGRDAHNFEKSTTVHAEGWQIDIYPDERLLKQNRGCLNARLHALAQRLPSWPCCKTKFVICVQAMCSEWLAYVTRSPRQRDKQRPKYSSSV